MFDLHQVGEKSYYINYPSKIGIYRQSDKDVYLIDTGNERKIGMLIHKVLKKQGWNLKGIINTHCHVDHIGGNAYLQEQTGCKIFAKNLEKTFINNTILESSFLYGGYPCKEMQNKTLMADNSVAVDITDVDFPKELEILPFGGHYFDMIGIRTPDNVLYLGDCICNEKSLHSYHLTYVFDVEQYIQMLLKLDKMDAKIFVPAHADAMDSIHSLIEANLENINEISNRIISICSTPMTFDPLLKIIFDQYNLKMDISQYGLIGSTVRSYLSWLYNNNYIKFNFMENELVYTVGEIPFKNIKLI